MRDIEKIRYRPREEIRLNYAALVPAISKSATRALSLEDGQKLTGLHVFVCRFLPKGRRWAKALFACMRSPRTTRSRRKSITLSRAAMEDMKKVVARITEEEGAKASSSLRYMFLGQLEVASDATASAEEPLRGQGGFC